MLWTVAGTGLCVVTYLTLVKGECMEGLHGALQLLLSCGPCLWHALCWGCKLKGQRQIVPCCAVGLLLAMGGPL